MNSPPPNIPRPPENPEDDPVAQARYETAMAAWAKKEQKIAAQMNSSSQSKNMTSQQLREVANGVHNDDDIVDDNAARHLSDVMEGDADYFTQGDQIDPDDEPVQKKKQSKNTKKVDSKRAASYRSNEYVILSRAYMEHSNDAVHSTDQKGSTFWGKVTETYNQLVEQANKLNEGVPGYTAIEGRTAQSLTTCWNRRVQKAVSKFSGICQTHPPASGEIKDDQKMDRYYKNMRALYYDRSEGDKSIPRKFDELMNAFKFLSEHPKFAIHFPAEGRPKSARKSSKVTHQAPPREVRPTGRDTEKSRSKVKNIVNEVTKDIDQSLQSRALSVVNNPHMEMLTQLIAQGNETMQAIQKQQIMAMAPSPQKKQFFSDLMAANVLDARNKKQKLELEQQRLQVEKEELELRKSELDKKKAAANAVSDEQEVYHDCNDSVDEKCCYPDCSEENMIGYLDKCANPECEYNLSFHHCCQITYLANHGKEILTKRCYQCSLDIVMGLNRSSD